MQQVILFSVCLLMASCASVLPPSQAMSDARQAIQAVQQTDANDYAAVNLAFAQRYLLQAEQNLNLGAHAYVHARFYALNAKQEALAARQISDALRAINDLQQQGTQLPADLYTQVQAQAALGDQQKVTELTEQIFKQLELPFPLANSSP